MLRAAVGMPVHNHGSEEGAGLICNESRLPDGSCRGACMSSEPHEKLLQQAVEAVQESYGRPPVEKDDSIVLPVEDIPDNKILRKYL